MQKKKESKSKERIAIVHWHIIQHPQRLKACNLKKRNIQTYSSQSKNLPRAFTAGILRYTIKVKDKLWKRPSIMPLPLSDRIQGLRGRLLGPGCSQLPLFIPHSHQFSLESARLRIVGPSRKDLRVCSGGEHLGTRRGA